MKTTTNILNEKCKTTGGERKVAIGKECKITIGKECKIVTNEECAITRGQGACGNNVKHEAIGGDSETITSEE